MTGEFEKLVDGDVDTAAFGAYIAMSTRRDNQEIAFCKPEIIKEDNLMPFPQQIKKGVSLYLASSLGSDKVVPQDIFVNEKGERMTIEELNETSDKKVNEPIQTLFYTGVQGGGKTENVRLQLILELLRKATGRVSAEKAWMAPPPKVILAKILPATTKGRESTFMGEASRIAEIDNSLCDGAMVFCDEPGNGTAKEEIEAIAAALAYRVASAGGHMVSTNHEMNVYTNLDMLSSENSASWFPVAYEYTDDPAKKYRLQHGKIGGAETFKIAKEMGIDPSTVELAEFIHQMQMEYDEHKKRLLQ